MKLQLQSSKQSYIFFYIIAIIAVSAGLFLVIPKFNTQAISANDFVAGRIIDDSVFYNKDAMSVYQIQDFLNKLIPNCDTWGVGKSEYGGGTRAQYAASVGWPAPPYACLNNYHENPQTGETSFEKGGGAFEGGVSAAQIIYGASQQYGINPQVLLVMLKKESLGPLTSDSWPLKSQYKYAMGYDCPDSGQNNSANCNSSQAGFYKQVMKAAWQFKYYKDHSNDYRYKIGVNQIQYSPDQTCGTKSVHIENIATLSLYIYTPYTPNDIALANYPNEAPCGSYGNRNFFMFFKEWFGSPSYRAPTCDAKVHGVTCVWRLYDPNRGTDFLTTNNQERDSAVINNHYSYDEVAFYAYTSQQPGTIPVYRIKLPDRHFYTPSASEKDTLIEDDDNTYEGIAFYALPTTVSPSISYQIYRLYGERGNLLTYDPNELEILTSSGYINEGQVFNTPSGFVKLTTPDQNKSNIYRLNNDTKHFYTGNLSEVDSLLRNNWKFEGMLLQSPSAQTQIPVYRLFNKSHIFTASLAERDTLINTGWRYEGVAWYVDDTTPQVYRFYMNNEHFYTSSLNEAINITNRSGNFETIAFGYRQGFYAPVYRLYNGLAHFYTANVDELLHTANKPWRYEGIAWQSKLSGTPVYRFRGTTHHIYTASEAERNALRDSGWKLEGIAWYTTPESIPVLRLQGPYHFYTTSEAERNALRDSGWKLEGIAW